MAKNAPFVEVRQSGFKELDKAFGKMGKTMTKNIITGATRKSSKPMVREARNLAPKAEGDAARTIKLRVGKRRGSELIRFTLGPDRDHFYLMFHEWGTIKIPAKPFLRLAWLRNLPEFTKTYSRDLGRTIEARGRKLFQAVNKGKFSRQTRRALGL